VDFGRTLDYRVAAISLLGVLVLTASPAFSRQVQGSVENTTATQTVGTCSQQLVSQFNSILSGVNSTAAIDLAVQSAKFQATAAGHSYTFAQLYSTDSYNPATCGDVALGVLGVSFVVKGAPGITVFENPELTNVTGVVVDNQSYGKLQIFSGYSGYDQVSGVTQKEYYSETIFNVPSSETGNSYCWNSTSWDCVMSPWNGLSYGSGGSGFLMQSGIHIEVDCSPLGGGSCSSTPVLNAWWECLMAMNPVTACQGGAQTCGTNPTGSYPVSSSDHIEAFEEAGNYSGGNGNGQDYEAFVQDTTASPRWICGSGWVDLHTSSYPFAKFGDAINEVPNGTAPSATPIPISWPTMTLTSLICPGTSNSSCVYYPSIGNTFQMQNPCSGTQIYNINLGSYSSSNGQFTEEYNNNCGS
jgi:hypothetical protein